MVTKEREFVAIIEAKRIILEGKSKAEMVEKLDNLPKRRQKPPTPEGSITLMEASRKYNIPPTTISYWLSQGWVKVLKHDGKYKFIKESDLLRRIENEEDNTNK